MSVIEQVDPAIRPLVAALREAGIDTDWSCSGEPGHMVIRPTVQARTSPHLDWFALQEQLHTIHAVLVKLGHLDAWISLTWAIGNLNTHGGEPVWLIQLPGRFDFLALPVAYASRHQDENDLVEWEKPQ